MAENLTVVGAGEPAAPVDWNTRRAELTAEAARLDLELAAVDGVRGRLVAEQAEGDAVAGEKLVELHRHAAELRDRRADVASALAVVRQRREEAARAGMAELREERRQEVAGLLRARLEAAGLLDGLLPRLEELVRVWRGLGQSASGIAYAGLGVSADVPLFSESGDRASLWDAMTRLAPGLSELLSLPGYAPGVAADPPPERVAESDGRRVAQAWQRIEGAAERERRAAEEPDGLVTLRRVA